MKLNILRSPAPGDSSGDATKRLAELEAENNALRAENAKLQKAQEVEPRIKEKMAAGLTREQAESVVKQQDEHDAWLTAREKEQADAKAKASKK